MTGNVQPSMDANEHIPIGGGVGGKRSVLVGYDGTDYRVVKTDATGALVINTPLTISEPVSVDDNGGSLTVDVGTALPAGTNNIGDVDVLSVIPGSASNNLGKREDDGHSTGDVGVMALAVRNDAAVARSGTDGDYEPIPVAVIDSKAGLPTHILRTVSAATTVGVTVSTTAVLVSAANAARKGIAMTNNNLTYGIYYGTTSSVTASGANMGIYRGPGKGFTDSGPDVWKGDWYAIRATAVASQSVSVHERT